MANTIHSLTAELADALEDLGEVIQLGSGAKRFVNSLGWDLPPGLEDIGLATLDFSDFLSKLQAVVDSSESTPEEELAMVGRVTELGLAAGALARQVDDLAGALRTTLASFGDYVDRSKIDEDLPRRLFDLLVVNHLMHEAPIAGALLNFLNVVEFRQFPADPAIFQLEHIRALLHFDHLKDFLRDPGTHLAQTYGWGTPEFVHYLLLQRAGQLLRALGLTLQIRPFDLRAEAALLGVPPLDPALTPAVQMLVTIFEEVGEVAGLRLGLSVFGVRPSVEGGSDGGIGFVPHVRGELSASIPFLGFDDAFLDISAEGEVLRRLALIVRAGRDIEIRHAAGVSEAITGRFALGLRHGSPESEQKTLLSFPGGVAILAQQIYLQGGIDKRSDRAPESFAELGLLGSRVIVSLDDADSFLKESIQSERLEAPVDFRVGWSSEQGIYFHGSSGLIVTLPAHAELGPLLLESVTLGLELRDHGLGLEASLSGQLRLGPLVAVVERVGVELDVSFERGNLGLFGLSPRFKAPSGIGLSVDGGGFKGGGFLKFEPELARYSGMLELEFQEQLTLKAIGLLDTRLPNGQSGFSLLIIISGEFTPIQLGFGFKLEGVGGLLGLNRTVNIERLVSGLRDRTLGSILFPTDVVANAERILSDLRQVFGVERGRFVFGPMAKLSWGTPALVTAELGLLLEVPEPVRLSLLGVVKSVLPDEREAILRLQVNFLGVVDFEKERLTFDASLYDSKLLGFALTGDMALRLYWGADANLLMTVGGFHPAYQPPPLNLPALRRLTLALVSGDNPRVTLEMYLALTSNTVQVGARVELYAAAWKFNAYGYLSFDALFQFNPFHFLADVTAMLSLRVGSSSVGSIKLTLNLEGPTPWKVKGEASLKLCWFFTLKIRFNKTFGEERNTTLPDALVVPRLVEALGAKDNWEEERAEEKHRLESVRDLSAAIGEQPLLHPVGTLKVSQKVVPLNVAVDRVGNQRPSDGPEFRIAEVKIGSGGVTAEAAEESFAPAQYFDMSDEEKLGSPSFKNFESGIRVGDGERKRAGYAAAREVKYELKYIDSQRDQRLGQPGKAGLFEVDAAAFNTWTLQGATSKAELSFARRRKSELAPEQVGVFQEEFALVRTSDLKLFDGESLHTTERAALKRRDALIAENPALRDTLQVVPAFERSA